MRAHHEIDVLDRKACGLQRAHNLLKRDDHNAFKPGIGMTKGGKDFTPKSLHDFANVAFGKKLDFIDDPWFQMLDDGTDNQLRNAIAHVKTDYDEVNQIITYYPRLEGMNQEKAEQITFIQFMKRLLQTYREMRRLNHLIRAGPGCLNRFSASISGVSAGIRPPSGVAAG
jgi:hypothetical protein